MRRCSRLSLSLRWKKLPTPPIPMSSWSWVHSWPCICGRVNDAAQKSCFKCKRVRPASLQKLVDAHAAKAKKEGTYKPLYKLWTCETCGMLNSGRAVLCRKCKAAFNSKEEHPTLCPTR